MTRDEFISYVKTGGAIFEPIAPNFNGAILNTALQNKKCAILASFILDLYKDIGGIILGNAYIFGPEKLKSTGKFPVPSILEINNEIAGLPQIFGKTVFGRNDLFWFAFDAMGICYMLDRKNLTPLRKYDDPFRAMTECLIVGKI